jgi:flagellar protein FlaG
VRRDANPTAPFSAWIELEMDMNIESVLAANPSQRVVTAEGLPQTSHQDEVGSATPTNQNNLRVETSRDTNTETNQLSVQEAVKHLEGFVSFTRADISFSIDEASGVQVVKVMDSQSKEVIRQFPSEEAIRIAQALDKLQGIFVKDKA